MFCKKGALRNFAKFTGKHLYQGLFLIKKETQTQVFSCEFCEISKNTFFLKKKVDTSAFTMSPKVLKINLTKIVSMSKMAFTKPFIFFNFFFIFKLFKGALLSLRQLLGNESPLKMKNAFYFTLKALLVLKILELLS